MTLAAERIKAAHRGFRQAAPVSRSRLAALESFGLHYDRVDDFNVVVEGDYQLNLAMSYWRSNDGTAQGYLVSALAAEIERNSQKPVTGRDSTAAQLTSGNSSGPAVAESVTGPSSALLPVVSPMTDTRPRSFIWQRNPFGPPTRQIVYDDPRVGSLDIKPVFEVALDPDDIRTLDQLARDYPAPVEAD